MKLAAIILNDVDDIMHGQQQGDAGMGQDIRLMAQQGRCKNSLSACCYRVFLYISPVIMGIFIATEMASPADLLEVEAKAQRLCVKGFC